MNSFWTFAAALISFGITALLGKWVVPYLRRVNFGQTIRDVGPAWHRKKNGTPTMGGFLFIAGILVSAILCLLFYYRQVGNNG